MSGHENIIDKLHKGAAQWIVRAPGRMNIIGEHTDYNLGYCMPAAIGLSVYMGAHFHPNWEIHSLHYKNCSFLNKDNITSWEIYFQGVLDVIDNKNIKIQAMKIFFGGDLPIGAGLSSSSALCCAFVYLINEANGLNLSREEMTKIAVEGERANGLEGGMMDQIAIMNGKKDCALFINCKDWSFQYMPCIIPDYDWLIIDTKVKHELVQSDYNNRSRACRRILTQLNEYFPHINSISELALDELPYVKRKMDADDYSLLNYVLHENIRVVEVSEALKSQNALNIGTCLLEGHYGLRDDYKVSCAELDMLVDFSKRSPHCTGARMMGGGFGGSTLHLVETKYIEEYKEQIAHFYNNKFGINPGIFHINLTDGVNSLY